MKTGFETAEKVKRKIGRPRAEVPRKILSVLCEQDLIDAVERARERRERASPGAQVTTSATVRALIFKALKDEDLAGQGELHLTLPMEPSTTKK